MQIAELEAQCNEADQEKKKNAQLTVRVQELETELREKEQVRRLIYICLETTGPVLRAASPEGVFKTMFFL